MKLTWLVVGALVLGCSKKAPEYKSNFATVKLEGDKITANGQPFTGTLIARDQEITVVAKTVLGATYDHMAGTELTGLVLVLPVDKGVPEGKAVVHLDLNAPKLNPEVARRSDEALAFARARSATIQIAEATFKAGKLDGTATVFAPAGKAGAAVKVAEVQFRDHLVHGTAVEYYVGANQPKRELHFEGGVQTGLQRMFHRNGKVEHEGSYVANEPDGVHQEYYQTGAKRAHRTYVRGRRTGTHETWFPTGQRKSEIVYNEAGDVEREASWYSNGASRAEPMNGVIEEYHPNGNVRSRATFENGEQHGPFAMFYEDNSKWKAGQFVRGKEVGRHQEWWKNGKPALDCTYVVGGYDGDYKAWYANGRAWETARYVNGQRDGAYRKWWKNGKPAHEYTYKNGKLDGDYKQHYDNGAKWVVAKYVMGKPQGPIQRWYPDGTLGYVMNHDANGRPDGSHKRWWSNGKPRLEATYVAGALDGEYKNWNEDGTAYEMATYQRGTKLQSTR